MVSEPTARSRAWPGISAILALIKPRQTGLLLLTGICGYTLTTGIPINAREAAYASAALFLSISGCTVLNMLLDRDIDSRMDRTATRPLPSGRVTPVFAAILGSVMSAAGLGLSFWLDRPFGLVVMSGFAFDLLLYTAWLKPRTPISVLLGGVAGGMPVLAGRVLALGRIDLVGGLLSMSVLLWIPSHILTLSTKYADDYRRAGVPTWPNTHGIASTRMLIAVATVLNAIVLTATAVLLEVDRAALALLIGVGVGVAALSVLQLIAPTDRRNWALFKLASVYMLASSLLLTIGSLA